MKLQKLSCPNCGGNFDIDVIEQKQIFCPYCGQMFLINEEKQETTINQNINIHKDINVKRTRTTINEADIIRAKTEDREKKYSWLGWVGCVALLGLSMGMCLYMMGSDDRAAEKAKLEGKITAGNYDDYKDENYEAVVEQLETLGFENITTIDLDDAGVAIWKEDKVESVSIEGDTTFYENDYYDPSVKIIIKYH